MNWLDPHTRGIEGHYPKALISAYYWKGMRTNPLPEDYFIFGDSGGYQVATRGAFADPAAVIRWQINNCTVGPLLDEPPAKTAGMTSIDPEGDWRHSLEGTVLNTRWALPYYLEALERGESFRWWGVIHGWTPVQQEEWHARVSEIYPFDRDGEGWCVKPVPPNDPIAVTNLLSFARDRGIENLHFFMTGSPRAIAVLGAFGQEMGFHRLTHDSSSPLTQANNRAVYVPRGRTWTTRAEKYRELGETLAQDYMREECCCASCRWLRQDLERTPEIADAQYFKYRMRFHNVLTVLEVLGNVERAAREDPDGLLEQLLGSSTASAVKRIVAGSHRSNTPVESADPPRGLLSWVE